MVVEAVPTFALMFVTAFCLSISLFNLVCLSSVLLFICLSSVLLFPALSSNFPLQVLHVPDSWVSMAHFFFTELELSTMVTAPFCEARVLPPWSSLTLQSPLGSPVTS